MKSKISTKDFYEAIKVLKPFVAKIDVPVVDLIAINDGGPHQILVATILSSRTKDEVTVKAVERLFSEIDEVADLKDMDEEKIAKLIFPVGFYKTKAKNLKKLPLVLEEEFDGEIPHTVDELVKLPGVGRKTANLVSSVAFGEDAICVDIHVHRITNRLGFLKTKDPFETEMELRRRVDRKYWKDINFIFVAYGQHLCKPVSPFCSKCVISHICKRVGVTKSR